MTQSIRWVAIALGASVVLAVLAVGAFVLLVNPNDYRQQISNTVQEKAGITLTLGGNLGWSFYPVLGFEANDVSLALQAGAPALLQVKSFAVGVRLMPLLSRQIDIDGIEIDGLSAHLIVGKDGKGNWQREPATASTSSPAAGNNASAALPVVRIPAVNIRHSQIRYEDRKSAQDYTVDIPRLQLRDVSLQEAFPLLLEARVREKAGLDTEIALNALLRADVPAEKYSAEDVDLKVSLAGVMPEKITLTAIGKVMVDQQQDTAALDFDTLHIADIKSTLHVQAKALGTSPTFSGKLGTETFDLRSVLKALGMNAPITRESSALSSLRADLAFSGTPQRINIKPLTLVVDDSTLSGSVAVTDVSRQAIQFDLGLDRINLDRYLAPASAATSSPAAEKMSADVPKNIAPKSNSATTNPASPPNAALLPVDVLRKLNLQGKLSVGEWVIKDIPVKQLGLAISALDGDVRLNDVRAQLLDGSLQGGMSVDVRGKQPVLGSQWALNNLNTEALLAPWVKSPVLSGRSSLRFDVRAQGNDSETLLRQALGQLNISMAEGVLHGVNLNQLVADALRQKLGDFTALMPDYETRLPKALTQDTALRDLLANMKIENGHLITPDLASNSDAGQFNAKGNIDLVEQSFDYRFGVVLTSLADHKYLKGTEWPVRCHGRFDAPAKDWCRPDGNAIGEVLKKAGGVALREKATEKLGEKLGVPSANEEEVKKKAQEKVNQQINRQLDKWLNRDKKATPVPETPAPAP